MPKFLNNSQKYSTLLSLYLAQSIPMTFFTTVMPVILRTEHYSLSSIGLLQLVKLPWILKFLWAPLVDKTGNNIQNYKKWIFSSEIFYAIIIFAAAFLHIKTNFSLIVLLMVIAFAASATQDIATDAFAYLVLKKEERSIGNSMQSAGSFLGTLTGSGVLLIVYYYFGWKYLLFALSGFVVLAILPLYFYKPLRIKTPEKVSKVGFKDIIIFFKQKSIGRRVLLLFIFYSGLIGILTMLKPWMVDLGYSIKEIGIISGIYGPAFGTAMALLIGFIIKKTSRKLGIIGIAILSIITSSYFWWLSLQEISFLYLLIGVLAVWGTYGMASVVIYTISMDQVRPGRAGTDFTIQIVITHLGSILLAVVSGKLAQHYGYTGLYKIEFIISLLLLLTFSHLYIENESEKN